MMEFVAIVLGMIVVILASCLAGERKMRADAQKLHEESERKRREEMLAAEGYRQMVKDMSDEAIESAAQIDKLEAENQQCNKLIGGIRHELESVRAFNKDFVEQVNRISAELVAAQALLVRESERSNCLAMRFREKEAEAVQANQLRSDAELRVEELIGKNDRLGEQIDVLTGHCSFMEGQFKSMWKVMDAIDSFLNPSVAE